MAIIGIGIGFFVFLFTGALVSEVLHGGNAGIFPGLVAAIWAARPFMHQAHIQRQNLLHPVPREYKVPAKVAFARIRDLLADTSYNFGDRWHVATADTQAGRISASLRFTDEHTHWEADARGHIHVRKQRLQRYIGLDVRCNTMAQNTSVIQLDFTSKAEGIDFFACDAIISGLFSTIDALLGGGEPIGSITNSHLPEASWCLKGMTALALLSLCADAIRVLFH